MSSIETQFGGHAMELRPERAIVIKELNALILSDVHLGKGAHFRRNGLPVPDGAFQDDLHRLTSLVTNTGCDLYVVGDLVHSTHNDEWERFAEERGLWNIKITLVTGNHDRHAPLHMERLGVRLSEKHMVGGLLLIHDERDLSEVDVANSSGQIVGHVHPAVRLDGLGARFVCFHIRDTVLTLPAFGRFTGMKTVSLEDTDRVFVCLDEDVLEIPMNPIGEDMSPDY